MAAYDIVNSVLRENNFILLHRLEVLGFLFSLFLFLFFTEAL